MPFVKFSCIGKASVSVPATPGDVDEFTAGEEGRPAMRKKGASINILIFFRHFDSRHRPQNHFLEQFIHNVIGFPDNFTPPFSPNHQFFLDFLPLPPEKW